MSLANFGKNILNKAYNAYADNLPKFTMHSTIAGWTLAVASNIFGIAIDKKVNKKEKKYLIPREIFDGAANIGLFVLITQPMTKFANKLVENGKIGIKGVEKLDKETLKMLHGGLGVAASLLGAVIVSNILAPIIRNVLATKSQKKYLSANENQKPQIAPIQTVPNQEIKSPMQVFLTNIHSSRANLKV